GAFNNLTHSGLGTLQLTGHDLSVSGALMNTAGIMDANGQSVTVAGLTTLSGGEYRSSTATQNFNGNLTISGGTLTASSGTVTGAFTLHGTAANLLALRSSTTGTQWRIDPQGTRSVVFADVKDSNNINPTAIAAITSFNSNNNTNWIFATSTLTWTGTTSTNWGLATNWDLGFVPNPTDNVVIPAVTNEPVLDTSRTIKNITIQTGAMLTLAGHDFTSTGTFTNAGTFKLQGGETVTLASGNDTTEGTWQYVGDGDATANAFTIHDNGATDYFNLQINDANATPDM